MATRPRVLEFDVSVDRDGTARSGLGGGAIASDEMWWAEHLVLAGLVRCTLTSLAYSARKAGLEVSAEGRAHGTVTKRQTDGLYAFVEIDSTYDVELSPAPDHASVADVIALAERGCFVGNSLVVRPRYSWTVNGQEIS